jgi:hypothetical protein
VVAAFEEEVVEDVEAEAADDPKTVYLSYRIFLLIVQPLHP